MTVGTLYVCRYVELENAKNIIAHFKAQGFNKCVKPEDLHTTITYSRFHVNWEDMGTDIYQDNDGRIIVPAGQDPRSVAPIGDEGAVVMHFVSTAIVVRHNEMIRLGASWDYSSYNPHLTISYNGDGIDLANVKPWEGNIILGPEKFDALKENWSSTIEEANDEGEHYEQILTEEAMVTIENEIIRKVSDV